MRNLLLLVLFGMASADKIRIFIWDGLRHGYASDGFTLKAYTSTGVQNITISPVCSTPCNGSSPLFNPGYYPEVEIDSIIKLEVIELGLDASNAVSYTHLTLPTKA